MNIVIDSNPLFSALIRDSATRRVILEYDGLFLFPSFIFIEMERYRHELLRKSGMAEKDFRKLLQLMLKKVVIVPNEVLAPYKSEAYEIVKDIDPNDVLFVACALAYSGSIIWSDDRKLKKQSRVQVLNTNEIIKFLGNY